MTVRLPPMPEDAPPPVFKTELERRVHKESMLFYRALPELLEHIPGKWVVFLNGKVVSVWDDCDSAYHDAVQRFDRDTAFVIARVTLAGSPWQPLDVPTNWYV